MKPHRFVLKIEDGHTSWKIICPDEGKACGPATACGSCGRTIGDDEIKPCYDCPSVADAEGCWVQSWVGEAMAEEVIYGTVEVEFPVNCEWNGDGLEAHVAGPATIPERRKRSTQEEA
jgi:hypothetical protein